MGCAPVSQSRAVMRQDGKADETFVLAARRQGGEVGASSGHPYVSGGPDERESPVASVMGLQGHMHSSYSSKSTSLLHRLPCSIPSAWLTVASSPSGRMNMHITSTQTQSQPAELFAMMPTKRGPVKDDVRSNSANREKKVDSCPYMRVS